MRGILYSLALILLIINMFTSNIASTIVKAEDSDTITYIAEEAWRIRLENIVGNASIVYRDLNNDDVGEIIVNGYYSNNSEALCVIDGATHTLWNCIALNDRFVASIAVNDVNNNGVRDIVAVTMSSTDSSSTIRFILWDPYTGKVVKSSSRTVDYELSVSQFPLAYDKSAETVYAMFTTSTGSLRLSYDIEANTISSTSYDNVFYIAQTTDVFGDNDNDGVIEWAENILLTTYYTFSLYGFSSTISIYNGSTTLFSKVSTSRFYGFAGFSNNGVKNYVWVLSIDLNQLMQYNKLVFYLTGYDLSGAQIYDILINGMPYSFIDLGDRFLIEYNDTSANRTYIAVYNAADGSLVDKIDVTGEETMVITGLGDIDDDGIKEVIYTVENTSYILKIGDTITKHSVTGIETGSTYMLLNTLTVNGNKYLVDAVVDYTTNTTDIIAYSFRATTVSDETPPVIEFTYPVEGALLPKTTVVEGIVYDNESGIAKLEAYLYSNATEENITVEDISLKPIDTNTYEFYIYLEFNVSGDYVLTVTAWNYAGLNTSKSISFKVDAEPPVITIYSPRDKGIYCIKDTPIPVNFTVHDEYLMNWTVLVNGIPLGNGNESGTYVFWLTNDTLLPITNTITIIANDEAGNHETKTIIITYYPGPFKFNFTLLTTFDEKVYNGVLYKLLEDEITLEYLLEGFSDVGIEYFRLELFENTTGEVYTIDLTLAFNETTTKTIDTTTIPDGVYDGVITIKPEGYDAFKLCHLGSIIIDNNDPSLNVTKPPFITDNIVDPNKVTVLTLQKEVEFNITCYAEDGVMLTQMTIYVDGEILNTYDLEGVTSTSKTEHVTLDEGEHTIRVIVTDIAGHTATIEYNVIVDVTPPSIEAFDVNVTDNNITIHYKVSDNLVGVDHVVIVVGNNTYVFNETEKTITLSNLTTGNYTVTLKVHDKAGLITTMSKNITVGKIIPPTTTTPPATQTPTTTSPTKTTSPAPTQKTTKTTTPAGGVPTTVIIGVVIAIIIVVLIVFWVMKK